jgi:hypothetical protein
MITTTRVEGEVNFGMEGQRVLWRRELRRVLTALRDLIQGAIDDIASMKGPRFAGNKWTRQILPSAAGA